jgi:hypothetical protein
MTYVNENYMTYFPIKAISEFLPESRDIIITNHSIARLPGYMMW